MTRKGLGEGDLIENIGIKFDSDLRAYSILKMEKSLFPLNDSFGPKNTLNAFFSER